LPTLFGEKIVMRLLDKGQPVLDMTRLVEPSHAAVERQILRPYGMVPVTGPTGQEDNTLYSSIAREHPETNIMTAEDPWNSTPRHQSGPDEGADRLNCGSRCAFEVGSEHHPGR
jgi:type II secretory ATPase GspE/PulE/Tfp pilus assembly ATPase PilB-like protein